MKTLLILLLATVLSIAQTAVAVLAVAFTTTNLFSQDDPVKNQNQIRTKEKNKIKTQTQTQSQFKGHGNKFVDTNGDGINDRAIDSDGDGIPNGKDADYVRPLYGTGQKIMNGRNYQNKFGGNRFGLGDGTGNSGVGPKDGTGYGSGSGTGSGNCDGTGPKGYTRGGRK